MEAYTICCYESAYQAAEEGDDIDDNYLHLNWMLCTLDEAKIELLRAIEASPLVYNYFVILDVSGSIIYSTTR